jgi:hypothetical protein
MSGVDSDAMVDCRLLLFYDIVVGFRFGRLFSYLFARDLLRIN